MQTQCSLNHDITIDGCVLTIDDLIKSYKKSQKLKSKINESALSYYHRNRETVLKKLKTNYDKEKGTPRAKSKCPCGSNVLIMKQHLTSLKHKSFIESQKQL